MTELTNNIVKFCSYDHTNLTLTCANWEVTQAESIIAGYNISQAIVTALKNILKKIPLVVPVEKYEINHFSGTFNASGINIQSVLVDESTDDESTDESGDEIYRKIIRDINRENNSNNDESVIEDHLDFIRDLRDEANKKKYSNRLILLLIVLLLHLVHQICLGLH
jgi:hypothetical protein